MAMSDRGSRLGAVLDPDAKYGRPKIPLEEGCTVEDGWSGSKHCYTMFGKPQEKCVKCGREHARITEWRKAMIKGKGWTDHPYVESGYWSNAEYKKYMKR